MSFDSTFAMFFSTALRRVIGAGCVLALIASLLTVVGTRLVGGAAAAGLEAVNERPDLVLTKRATHSMWSYITRPPYVQTIGAAAGWFTSTACDYLAKFAKKRIKAPWAEDAIKYGCKTSTLFGLANFYNVTYDPHRRNKCLSVGVNYWPVTMPYLYVGSGGWCKEN